MTSLLQQERPDGPWAGAVAMLRKRVSNLELILGPEHPETLECIGYLAALHYDLGDYDRAARCFRKAYERKARSLGMDHVSTRGTLGSLVDTLACLDDLASIEPLLWRELEFTERDDGPDHPDVHPLLVCLSECLLVRGEYGSAIALLERALGIIRAHEGEDAEDTIATAERIDGIRERRDRGREARRSSWRKPPARVTGAISKEGSG